VECPRLRYVYLDDNRGIRARGRAALEELREKAGIEFAYFG
jgi:hypothetical protein